MTPRPEPRGGTIARPSRRPVLLAAVWVLAALAILPVVFRWQPPPPAAGQAAALRSGLGYLLALFVCYRIYRAESLRLPRREAMLLVFLIAALTAITSQLHSVNVDHGVDYFPHLSNTAWQLKLQGDVMRLSPGSIPDSYRFLPNAIVRWMELAGLSYERARDLYRLIAGMLLFYAIYRYARLFTTYLGGVIAISLVAVVFPVSYQNYAGQLTDPLSHLSFVLAFIFIETGDFGGLLATILIGSLAKESVLAMAGYYVLFRRSDRGNPLKAVTLCGAGAAVYLAVRFAVLRGPLAYAQISHAPPQLLSWNLADPRWPVLLLLTVGVFWPFLVLGWNETPLSLRRLALYLLPVLWISSAFFSFLAEMRNFMPLVFVLAVTAGWRLAKPSPVPG